MARRSLALVAFAAFAAGLHAQSGSRLTDPPPAAPSRWQAQIDALDGALRARALTANDPKAYWVAGWLDAGDPVAQADAFAQARVAAPGEKMFLASLAMSCLAPVQPLPAPCDATDRLADWASRDVDNGVPSLLLADRARARNNATAMIAYLDEAAQRPRFDDYGSRGSLLLWDAVRALPGDAEPAARAELVATYALRNESLVVRQMPSLCRDGQQVAEPVRAACNKAGTAVAERAATWPLRIAGARMAERSAAAGAAQDAAKSQLADVQRRAYECAQAGDPLAAAFESPDAAVRARAVAQWSARLAQDAQVGEVAACAAPAKG
ncbi:MAG: hypothetical protein U1F15_01315 [Burkholderiales bacterium]